MIYFNEETRSFGTLGQSIKDASRIAGAGLRASNTGRTAGAIGAVAGIAANRIKRNNLEKKYEAEGKSVDEAKKLARKNTKSDLGAAWRGDVKGRVIRHGVNAIGGVAGIQMKDNHADRVLNGGLKRINRTADLNRVKDILNRKKV